MWKDIEGYEGYYQISDSGDVLCLERRITKSNGVVQTRKQRKARIFKDKDGYLNVKLNKDGVSKVHKVHRLVAKAFVGGYSSHKEVNHKDFNRENNAAYNLEWVDHKNNIRHSASNGRYSDRSGSKNPNYGNHSLREKYKSDPQLRQLQSRPGVRNGRATPITVVHGDKNETYAYISLCAELLIAQGVTSAKNISYVASKISSAAKSGTMYLNRMFYINCNRKDNTEPSYGRNAVEGVTTNKYKLSLRICL